LAKDGRKNQGKRMQRTVVVYALALSTLIGALLLAPRVQAPEPDPLPEPVPAPEPKADRDPITRLTYADGTLRVDARLDRGALLRAVHGPTTEAVWMDVSLRAIDSAQRAALSAVLVVDRSGSMAGAKIEAAREAAEKLLARMLDGERIAVVSYGSDVTVDVPFRILDPNTRAAARRAIRAMEEGGGTNIDGAMKAAHRLLSAAPGWEGVSRVVLISDGRATEGERREDRLVAGAAKLRQVGATVSTLGLGLDYNESLMEALATAGSGRYHYLRRAAELAPILDDEVEHATKVVAREVRLLVEHSGELEAVEAFGAAVIREGSGLVLDLGDMAAGEERRVLVRLEARLLPHGETLERPAPTVLYKPTGAATTHRLEQRADRFRMVLSDDPALVEPSVRPEVTRRALQVRSSMELTRSMEALATGRVDEAKRALRDTQAAVAKAARASNDKGLLEEAQNLQQVLDTMQSAKPSSAASQDMVKHQRARAYSIRR
jgi:Ca-activated chloride channel homolog